MIIPRKNVILINIRKEFGLVDELGYPLCTRCECRIEDPAHSYCDSCAEIVKAEVRAGLDQEV